ncbi:MAG: hypothetical protein GSR80_001080 [Desulfurococcales archaeon]|nr:hypothetical protein [Desulfurococcales archaeon]
MASAGFKLELAPPETLGRRFQLALLSLDPGLYTLNATAGYAAFTSPDDYVELVEEALGALRALESESPRKCKPTQVAGIDCCKLHRGPKLYTAGASDYTLLRSAGFTRCAYSTSTGKESIAWSHAAVSYAAMVLDSGGPLGGAAKGLPWLAKSTVFGKVRVAGGGRQAGGRRSGSQVSLDTLGSVLLGGAIAFLWSQRVGRDNLEFYLVPDAVHRGYAALRELMVGRGLRDGVAYRAARLASELPVSIEVALALALAVELAEHYKPARELAAYTEVEELERAATVVTVTPQQRPMVRSTIPLTSILYAAYDGTTLREVLALAWASRGAPRGLEGLRDAVGGCINAMFLQAMHARDSDHLSGCIRSLAALADAAHRRGLREWESRLGRLAWRLARDYLEMARGVAGH